MQTTSLKLYSLHYGEAKIYGVAFAFALGNIVFPQLCHLAQMGGPTWLPIYFFTLVGAYKYGWKAGLLVAVMSPLANSWLFGMPATEALPAILLKSILLAVFAGLAAGRFQRATLPLLTGVVLAYQVLGTAGEWLMEGSLYAAAQDFRMGLPGMLLQVVGAWLLLNGMRNKG